MKDKLIVALDFDSLEDAEKLIDVIYPVVKIFKVGYQLFYKEGWKVIKFINQKGGKVFLDLKLCDIPNTAAKAASVLSKEDIFMFNVHALGGYKMMSEAVSAAKNSRGKNSPLVIAVTLLTSFDENALVEIGFNGKIEEEVIRLALLSQKAGVDGVVTSPWEVENIKKACGRDFLAVCPGIRLESVCKDDQKRTASASEAIKRGADYIVAGRPITQAKQPLRAVKEIKEQIESAQQER